MSSFLPADFDRLVDSAKREAARLRRDTINSWLDEAGRQVAHPVRAARRLAASVSRHTRIRHQQGA
ncbi:hypothetical protein [Caenimonas aquaedulcis]|uniref:Uncharacterized protein n=1 Tax=Caenimonas aquaedulcis TaxID=2793270 RepID=A0A931H645_9BURK|nr:hypothetical protein [Caenimonas aquaedulcis]MBG9389276.1 hypothetical protein [Caenimonas aquaedulcis]